MPATNYTPILLYRTATASTTAPAAGNLNFGELAINYNASGMILYAKNASGSVIKLMNNPANLLYPTADGSANQAIVTNGSGTLSFATISTAAATPTTLGTVYGSMTTNSSTYLTAAGYNAGAGNTGNFNTAFGTLALDASPSGAANNAFGVSTLGSNTTGASNSGFGHNALASNTTGDYNVAVGQQALDNNTTGSINTAVGYQAARNAVATTRNVAIGAYSMGLGTSSGNGYNTAVGTYSLYKNSSGENNVAMGEEALYENTTGTNNTALGRLALTANTTANNNTGIGYQSLYSNTTASNNTAIGYQAGYSLSTGNGWNTFVGREAGRQTTGDSNTFVGSSYSRGAGAGYFVTSGSKNTILGGYDGNQDGLDIRTASNYAVISDGDGNRLLSTANGYSLALDGGAVPQSGTGITFPATQSASSDANTLDDYEEGTFTPTISGSSSPGTGTYSIQVGAYTKVGRQVSISIWIAWSAHTGTGNLQITNLPFSSNGTSQLYNAVTIGYANNLALTANNVVIAHNPNNSSRIDFYQYAAGGGANSLVAIDTDASIIVSATYFV